MSTYEEALLRNNARLFLLSNAGPVADDEMELLRRVATIASDCERYRAALGEILAAALGVEANKQEVTRDGLLLFATLVLNETKKAMGVDNG